MIVILSSSAAERSAFAALCESRGWPATECDSLKTAGKLFSIVAPRVVLTRHQLTDGYSDDVLGKLAAARFLPTVKVIVLMAPGASSAQVARQVALGADCVLRDPVRTDVLGEYLARYHHRSKKFSQAAAELPARKSFRFAGAIVQPADRRLLRHGRSVALTPREIQLVELLHEARGDLLPYTVLYSEITGGKFCGDTTNMRVLLTLLDASFRSVGIRIREFIEVIPKAGYRYHPPSTPRPTAARRVLDATAA